VVLRAARGMVAVAVMAVVVHVQVQVQVQAVQGKVDLMEAWRWVVTVIEQHQAG
jgi:hypothetical protein